MLIHVLMVHMVQHQHQLQMQIGKLLRILKVIHMVKDDHNQVIQQIHQMLIPVQHNILIQAGIIIKVNHLKDQVINIIMALIHLMVNQMHLHINKPLVMIIFHLKQLHKQIIIVNREEKQKTRANILYSLSSL